MQEKPQVSELLQKLCSWAVITMLDFHPRRASMPITLVYKVAGNSSYQVEADSADAGTLEELLEMTRSQLVRIGEDAAVEGYALIVDSLAGVTGLPDKRPSAESGEASSGRPTIFVFLGDRGHEQGVLVVQEYKERIIRGGAQPFGAPLIIEGPASLLQDATGRL